MTPFRLIPFASRQILARESGSTEVRMRMPLHIIYNRSTLPFLVRSTDLRNEAVLTTYPRM